MFHFVSSKGIVREYIFTTVLCQSDKREFRLIASGDVVSLNFELVDCARAQVSHDKSSLHLDAVGYKCPVEFADGSVLYNKIENRTAVIWPHVQT